MPDKTQRQFVFLLKFNTDDIKDVVANLDSDMAHLKGCWYLPVAGDYDLVVNGAGTETDALTFALYLRTTGRYTTTTLTGFTEDEFGNASKVVPPVSSKKK